MGSPSPPTSLLNSDSIFAQAVVDALRELYSRGDASNSEIRSKAAFVAAKYQVAVNFIHVSEGDAPVLILAIFPDPARPFYSTPYFFWQDTNHTISYQVWQPGEPLFDLLQNSPEAVRVQGRGGQLEMGLISQPFGATSDIVYFLLRQKDNRWRIVWSPLDLMHTGEWMTSAGRITFAGNGLDLLELRGPIPQDVLVPRFFFEFGIYERQQYDSLWQRQDDRYVRISGLVIDSPLTALTELIIAMKDHDVQRAQDRVSDPKVIERVLQLNLDDLSPGEWVATKLAKTTSIPQLQIGRLAPSGILFKYTVSFMQKDGRWLVQDLSDIP